MNVFAFIYKNTSSGEIIRNDNKFECNCKSDSLSVYGLWIVFIVNDT